MSYRAPGTADLSEEVIILTSSGTETLPLAASCIGKVFYYKYWTTGISTIQRTGSDTIDAYTSISIGVNKDCLWLVSLAAGKWGILNYMVTNAASAVVSSSTITVTASTPKEIVFDTENYDSLGQYDATTGRFTAQIAGYYQFDAGIRWTNGATAPSVVQVYLRINGGATLFMRSEFTELSNAVPYQAKPSGIIRMAAGDYVSVWVNSITQNITVVGDGTDTQYLYVRRICDG